MNRKKIQQEKLDVVALLVADPYKLNSTIWQNLHDFDPPLYRHLLKSIIK